MKEPTDEQVKELWEWCGWRTVTNIWEKLERTGVGLNHADDLEDDIIVSPTDLGGYESYPNLDLNSLFLYAVPKVGYTEIKYAPKAPFVSVTILHENNEYYGLDKDPALALFWAIYGAIK